MAIRLEYSPTSLNQDIMYIDSTMSNIGLGTGSPNHPIITHYQDDYYPLSIQGRTGKQLMTVQDHKIDINMNISNINVLDDNGTKTSLRSVMTTPEERFIDLERKLDLLRLETVAEKRIAKLENTLHELLQNLALWDTYAGKCAKETLKTMCAEVIED